MNERGMKKIVQTIPEKKRKEIARALRATNSREEAAAVVAKYASFLPKSQVKEIFDSLEREKSIDYDAIQKTAEDLIAKMKKS